MAKASRKGKKRVSSNVSDTQWIANLRRKFVDYIDKEFGPMEEDAKCYVFDFVVESEVIDKKKFPHKYITKSYAEDVLLLQLFRDDIEAIYASIYAEMHEAVIDTSPHILAIRAYALRNGIDLRREVVMSVHEFIKVNLIADGVLEANGVIVVDDDSDDIEDLIKAIEVEMICIGVELTEVTQYNNHKAREAEKMLRDRIEENKRKRTYLRGLIDGREV